MQYCALTAPQMKWHLVVGKCGASQSHRHAVSEGKHTKLYAKCQPVPSSFNYTNGVPVVKSRLGLFPRVVSGFWVCGPVPLAQNTGLQAKSHHWVCSFETGVGCAPGSRPP